jgi:hypothetical protein
MNTILCVCVCVCVAVLQLIFVTLGMSFQVGRYYYDPAERISMDCHNLELWPGYVTSIRHHENELLLCVELTHKVMRLDTVYDLFQECCNSQCANYQVISKSLASHLHITPSLSFLKMSHSGTVF